MKLSFTKNDTEKVSKLEFVSDFNELNVPFIKDNAINETFKNLFFAHVTSYTHSIYTYTKGRKGKDSTSASGVIVDVDDTCSIEKFQQDWKQYHYILYTSKSHQKEKVVGEETKPPCDRFHVFFPYQEIMELNDTNRDEYNRNLSAFVDSTPYFDQQVKDLGRIIFKSPKNALCLTNFGLEYLNPTKFVFKSLESKKQEIDTSRPRNDYTLETLQDCLEILISERLEHDFYKKICAWAREEPEQTKQIVCDILGNNPFYPQDNPEIVLKHIMSFPRSDVNFASIYKRAKEIQPTYKQRGSIKHRHWHGLDTKLEWDETNFQTCLSFFNDVLGYSAQTKSYFLRTAIDSWTEHKPSEIGEALSHFCIQKETKNGDVTRKPFFPIWKQSPQKRVFFETLFDFDTPTTQYTLNTAPELVGLPKPVEHQQGLELIKPVVKVLKESLCDGDEKKFLYLMVWSAYVTNYKKTGIGVQIKGASGTGKTSFRLFLEKFLHPKTHTKVSKDSQLAGKFNSQLAGKILVTSEEAVYAGNTSHSEVLKDLVTDDTMELERKGRDVETNIKNYINVLFLSNRDIVTKLDVDDRRFFVMTTSDKYSKQRYPEKANEIGEAFRQFKLALTDIRVLESFQWVFEDLRKKYSIHWLSEPKNMTTAEKKEIQMQCLNPVDELLHTLYTENFAMPIRAEKEDMYGKITYTKLHIDTTKTFFLFDALYDYFLTIGRENRYHSRNMLRRELGSYILEKVLKNVDGVIDKTTAKRVVVLEQKKVIEHLKSIGIEIDESVRSIDSDNVINFDQIPRGL